MREKIIKTRILLYYIFLILIYSNGDANYKNFINNKSLCYFFIISPFSLVSSLLNCFVIFNPPVLF